MRKLHLCEDCNREQEPISPELLASILPKSPEQAIAGVPAVQVQMVGGAEKTVTCSSCGLTLDEFRRFGRFGCAEDYTLFSEQLDPIFTKIHGSTVHVGRVPPNTDVGASSVVRLRTLETELKDAIAAEDYEEAARLRDEVRQLREDLHGAG